METRLGDDHFLVYTDVESQCCTLETCYIMLYINTDIIYQYYLNLKKEINCGEYACRVVVMTWLD